MHYYFLLYQEKRMFMNSTISFWQLISQISKIEIPIIQRDYAQGRKDEKAEKIRKRFLENLISAISGKSKPLELDFVYGSTIKKEKEETFYPLDGQQRLTTLFLLHWTTARIENKLESAKENLLKFTYETRTTSRDFCKALVKNGENLGVGNTVSGQIKDASWFFLSWEKDPTVNAMLVMLDDIEIQINQIQKQGEYNDLFGKLISMEAPPVIFHFKELNNFGFSDDLYIKMNARGKLLTDFENFKARFEKHVAKWESQIQNNTETFSHKIDTTWTDLFWKYRNSENQIDESFIKFIAGIAINFYAQNQDIYSNEEEELLVRKDLERKAENKSVTAEAIKRNRIERRIAELFNKPNDVNPKDFFLEDAFNYLKKCINIYSTNKYDELFPDNVSLWDYSVNSTIFKEFIKDKESAYKQRVLFFAQTEYLVNQQVFNKEAYSDWMRVVRNIIQNSYIYDSSTFIGAIGLIKELSKGCCGIYAYLHSNVVKSRFAAEQITEEVLKSNIISATQENKEVTKKVLFDTEDTNFCKGKIKFPLYCIGYEKAEDTFDVGKLDAIRNVICQHLNNDDVSNEFRRALLTIRSNDFYLYWNTSWSYGTDSKKRCLIEGILDLQIYFTYGYFQDYLKDLLNLLISKNIEAILNDYSCPDGIPNWKRRLIKEPNLLNNHCTSHFIGIPSDDSCCYLFRWKKRPSNREECEKVV